MSSETDKARWARWEDLRLRKELATTESERETLQREEEELREQGIRQLLYDDVQQGLSWWWLSFVDETGTFLGVAIVEAGGVMEAALAAKLAGCNPGGEVAAYPLLNAPRPEHCNRLFSEAELKEAGLI